MKLAHGKFAFEYHIEKGCPATHSAPPEDSTVIFDSATRNGKALTNARLEKIVYGKQWKRMEELALEREILSAIA